jgi:serine/threonine-protein kinase
MAAVNVASGTTMAIKYLSPRLLATPGFLEAFRAEAALLRSLDVPQVVRLVDYVEAPGQGAAIIMELVDGVSLHEMITRQGSTSPESALLVLKGSLQGLAAAHALGIVHRDYKPENVLVDGSGQSKLTDFGVAAPTGQAMSGGTPLYMAPEQWNGAPATPATDIYAATAVFFECLTGMTPFSGPLGQLAAQHAGAAVPVELIDEPLRDLITRGMAKSPADRPADATAFLADLEATATGAYGDGWESRGLTELARRAAVLLALLHGAAAATATAAGAGTASVTTTLAAAKVAGLSGLQLGIAAAVVAAAVGGSAAGLVASHAFTPGPHPTATPRPTASTTLQAVAFAACRTGAGAPLAYLTSTSSGTATAHSVAVRCGAGSPRVLDTFTQAGTAVSVPSLAWSADGSQLAWTTGSEVYVARVTAGTWSLRRWACQGCAGLAFQGGQAVSVASPAGGTAVTELLRFPESGPGQPTTEAISGIPASGQPVTDFEVLGHIPGGDLVVQYGNLAADNASSQLLYDVSPSGQATEYGHATLDGSPIVGSIGNFTANQEGTQAAFSVYFGAGITCPSFKASLLDTATGTVTFPALPPIGAHEAWLVQGMWFDRSGTPYVSAVRSAPSCGGSAASPYPVGATPTVFTLSNGTWVAVGSGAFQAAYGPGSWLAEITGVTGQNDASPTTLTISDGPGTAQFTVPGVTAFAWAP